MADRLLQLYENMHRDRLKLFDYRIIEDKAATIKLDGEYAVFIDTGKIESAADEMCTIAHEYGHCKTGSTHTVYSDLDLICRHEYKADKWAVHEILPPDDMISAMQSGCTEVWQLAERFDMPEDFIRRAIQIYQNEELIA